MVDRTKQVSGTTGTGTELMGPPVLEAWIDQSDGTHARRVVVVAGTGTTAPQIQGNVANDASDTGTNPVKIGGIYSAASTISSKTVGDRTDMQTDIYGNIRALLTGQSTTDSDGQANTVIQAFLNSSNAGGSSRPLAVVEHIFNGATVDRMRSVAGVANTTGTGAVAVGLPLLSTSDMSQVVITNAAASGDTTLLAAVSAQSHRVHRLRLSVAGACIVKLYDGAAGTLFETWNFAGNGGALILDLSDRPYYKGTNNVALVLNVSAAVQVDGRLGYITAA